MDDEYQDPAAAGSLRAALTAWRSVRSSRQESQACRVVFTLACPSEARATRVAGFLRRRVGCAETRVHHVAGSRQDTWHVHGSTSREIQSLRRLESLWSWLRLAAERHQVTLLRVSVT